MFNETKEAITRIISSIPVSITVVITLETARLLLAALLVFGGEREYRV
jgi:hypothetical protein